MLVDPGPQSAMETLLEALGDERPRALLLTHIHFDHAGATGRAGASLADLPVYVHERGAPHLADRRGSWPAPAALRRRGGLDAPVGRGRPGPGGEPAHPRGRRDRRRGRLPRRVHARPRLPPRLLPPRADAAAHSSATWPACAIPPRAVHAGPHAAAGHRRRGVERSLDTIAGWEPGARADPLRARSTIRRSSSSASARSLHAQAATRRRARTRTASSRPTSAASTSRPGGRRRDPPGRAARPALPRAWTVGVKKSGQVPSDRWPTRSSFLGPAGPAGLAATGA